MTRIALSCIALASLAACSSFGLMPTGDKVDYRTQSKQTTGLEVPPDLTQLQRPAQPSAVGGVSAAELANRPATTAVTAPAAAQASVAINQVPNAEIVRVGTQRLIRSPLPPEQLWPQVRSFWTEMGFDLPKDQADIGVLETDWKENRAKLPQDLLRRTLGSLLDNLYSTGERDQFRTRLERVGNATEITVSHRGMQEVYTNAREERTGWTSRPSDPELEAEMLSRLLLRLGGRSPVEANATTAATAAPPAPAAAVAAAAPVAAAASAEVPDQIVLNEDFDRAWRRVGQSLDRHGFTVEDRDRKLGLFFLRWADPRRAGKEEPNWFMRLFTKDEGPAMNRYRVAVISEGGRSTVRVQDDKGQKLSDDAAKRILGLLQQDLR